MQLVDLEVADPRWAVVLPVLQELRPQLDAGQLRRVYAEGWQQGYRFLAALDDDGACLGVSRPGG